MKLLKLTVLALLAPLMTACNREPVYDVQHYLDHPDERKAMLERCKNNPGELEDTPNCKNAEKAWVDAPLDLDSIPKIR